VRQPHPSRTTRITGAARVTAFDMLLRDVYTLKS
jgi:hypothetical protein